MASDGSVRVMVTGATGYLGQFLVDEILSRSGISGELHITAAGTYSTRGDSIPPGVQPVHLDFRDAQSIERALTEFTPDIVINLAAMSSPAACEKNKADAEALNAPVLFLDALAQKSPDALFIQISTDQIFDGNHPTYSGTSEALPVNTYGATKLLFEAELRGRWPNHVILRSSLIYGPPPPRPCVRQDTFLQVR